MSTKITKKVQATHYYKNANDGGGEKKAGANRGATITHLHEVQMNNHAHNPDRPLAEMQQPAWKPVEPDQHLFAVGRTPTWNRRLGAPGKNYLGGQ